MRQNPIGGDHRAHIGGFDGKHNIGKIALLQKRGMPKRALRQRLRGRRAVLDKQMLFQRPGIHPDANGNAARGASRGNRPDPLGRADISGIDADFIDPCSTCFKRQAIIKMNICDKRHCNARFLDFCNHSDRLLIGNGHANHSAARLLQPAAHGNTGICIVRIGAKHGLHQNRRIPAYLCFPGEYRTGFSAIAVIFHTAFTFESNRGYPFR